MRIVTIVSSSGSVRHHRHRHCSLPDDSRPPPDPQVLPETQPERRRQQVLIPSRCLLKTPLIQHQGAFLSLPHKPGQHQAHCQAHEREEVWRSWQARLGLIWDNASVVMMIFWPNHQWSNYSLCIRLPRVHRGQSSFPCSYLAKRDTNGRRTNVITISFLLDCLVRMSATADSLQSLCTAL